MTVTIGLLTLAACGPASDDDAPEVAEPDEPETTEAPDVPETEEPTEPDPPEEPDPGPDPGDAPADGDAVTEADDGSTLTLDPGDEVPLRLSNDWVWDQPRIDGDSASIELVPVDYFDDPGFTEWVITAVGPGTAEVTADGEPACGDPDECPARTVTIRVEVG